MASWPLLIHSADTRAMVPTPAGVSPRWRIYPSASSRMVWYSCRSRLSSSRRRFSACSSTVSMPWQPMSAVL